MNEGTRWKKKLFSEQGRAQLEKLQLAPWASRRRKELLELLDRLNPTIEELTAAIEQEAKRRPEVLRLMTHPGVGPITALAFVLIRVVACGMPQVISGLRPGIWRTAREIALVRRRLCPRRYA
jgi:transposase